MKPIKRRRISIRDANVAYRVLSRLQILAARRYDDAIRYTITPEQRAAIEADATALSRMVGKLEFEIFGGVMWAHDNPLADPGTIVAPYPEQTACRA